MASSTQVVNTDAGCVATMGNVRRRCLVLLATTEAVPPQSSLFALPSRGSAQSGTRLPERTGADGRPAASRLVSIRASMRMPALRRQPRVPCCCKRIVTSGVNTFGSQIHLNLSALNSAFVLNCRARELIIAPVVVV